MITAKNYYVLAINLKKDGDKLVISTQYQSPYTYNGKAILISQVRSRMVKTKDAIRERWFVKLADMNEWVGSFHNLGEALDVFRKEYKKRA